MPQQLAKCTTWDMWRNSISNRWDQQRFPSDIASISNSKLRCFLIFLHFFHTNLDPIQKLNLLNDYVTWVLDGCMKSLHASGIDNQTTTYFGLKPLLLGYVLASTLKNFFQSILVQPQNSSSSANFNCPTPNP